MGMVSITIKASIGVNPIDGVLVSIYDPAAVFLTSGLTNNLGEAVFSLDGTAEGILYSALLMKGGWSFPPQNQKSILVKDPAVPDIFEYEGEVGTDLELVAFIVKDDQAVPAPVDDVEVRVHDHIGNFLSYGMTGQPGHSHGEVVFLLPGAESPGIEYRVWFYKLGLQIPAGPVQRVSVLKGSRTPYGGGGYGSRGYGGVGGYPQNTFEVIAHTPVAPEATNPALCKLSGYLVNPSLEGIPNLTVRFRPQPGFDWTYPAGFMPYKLPIVAGNIVVNEVRVKTDSKGYLDVQLQRGCHYDVHIYGMEHPVSIAQVIRVPDAAGAKLEDVIYPFISDVIYSPQSPIFLAVGEIAEVSVVGMASDGFLLDTPPFGFVQFYMDNEDIAIFEVSAGKLRITGVAAGTTSILAFRMPASYCPRFGGLGTLPGLEVTVS